METSVPQPHQGQEQQLRIFQVELKREEKPAEGVEEKQNTEGKEEATETGANAHESSGSADSGGLLSSTGGPSAAPTVVPEEGSEGGKEGGCGKGEGSGTGETKGLVDIEELAEQFEQTKLTPLQQFKKGRGISVTEFSAQLWCETQLQLQYVTGRKRQTAAMAAGIKRHAEIESDDHTTEEVEVETREDLYAFKALNSVLQLDMLRQRHEELLKGNGGGNGPGTPSSSSSELPGARVREVWVCGLVNGLYVSGIIDELRIVPCEGGDFRLLISDTKTRQQPSLPSMAQRRTSAIQLQVYHRMVSELRENGSGSQFAESLPFSALNVDPDKRLVHPELLAAGMHTIRDAFRAFSESFVPLPPLLAKLEVVYECKGELLSRDLIPQSTVGTEYALRDLTAWWKGERETDAVTASESWKCKFCDFLSECSRTPMSPEERAAALAVQEERRRKEEEEREAAEREKEKEKAKQEEDEDYLVEIKPEISAQPLGVFSDCVRVMPPPLSSSSPSSSSSSHVSPACQAGGDLMSGISTAPPGSSRSADGPSPFSSCASSYTCSGSDGASPGAPPLPLAEKPAPPPPPPPPLHTLRRGGPQDAQRPRLLGPPLPPVHNPTQRPYPGGPPPIRPPLRSLLTTAPRPPLQAQGHMRPVEPVKTGGVSAVPPAHSGASRLDMSKSGGMHRFPMGASNSSSFSSKEQQQQHQKTQPRFHPGPLPALPAGSAEKGGKGQRREEYTQPTMRMSALGMEDEDVVMDGDSSPPSCSSAAANVEMAEDTGTGPGKGNSATADPRGNVGQMAAQQQQQQQQRFFNPHTQTQAQKETVLRPLCEPNRAPPNKPGAPASSSFKFPFPPQQNTQRSNQKTPATNTSFNSSQGHQKDHREAASSAVAPAGLSRGGRGIDRGRDNFSREFPAPTSTSFSAHPLPSSSNVAPGAALGGGVACSGSGNGMERRKPGTAVPLVVNTGGKRKSSAPSPSAKNGSKRGGEGGAPAPRKQVKLQQQQSQQQQQQTATGAQRGKRKAAAAGQNPPSASTSAAPLQKQKAQTTIFSHFPVKPKAPSQPTQ